MRQFFFAALFAGMSALALTPAAMAEAPPPALLAGSSQPSLAPMISRVTKSIVNISTSGHVKVKHRRNPLMNDPFFRRFFGQRFRQPSERKFEALGSGVIVNADKGYILTNNHVIDNADKITVILNNGHKYDAKVVGKDPLTDLAVIQIDAKNLHQLSLGDSSHLHVGDFVVAIGNPFGLSHTATFGIVSGMGRVLSHKGGNNQPYQNFIQTDASINPGNSGGALVNLKGQLVGVNSAIYSKGGGNIGIGFAIPVNLAKDVMQQLIKHGKVERGHLGVMIQTLNPKLAKAMKLDVDHGAVVTKVEDDSPADKAGIKQGDVIVKIDGEDVDGSAQLRNHVGLTRPGTKVKITLIRDGDTKHVSATLAKGSASADAEDNSAGSGKLGAHFSNLTRTSPLYGEVQGVVVTSVKRASQAARAGLRAGDVVVAVNRHPIKNLAQFHQALSRYKGTLLLTVRRGSGAFFTTLR